MIIGHETIWKRLLEDVEAGRLHHAQLFMGPKGVGKTRVALELAVHLQERVDNPALRKQLLEGLHEDTLLYLDAGAGLPIAEIRKLIERVNQSHRSAHLVVVLENIGRMKPEAANALLKTLEEPVPGVVFLLTANREEDVLDTIRSRCHITWFQSIADEELKNHTDGHVATEFLVRYSMGRPGKLKRLLTDEEYRSWHESADQSVIRFLESPDVPKVFQLARDYEKSEWLLDWLDILLQHVRRLALTGQKSPMIEHLDLTEVLDSIELAKQDIEGNVNKGLVIQNLLLPFAP